MFDEIIEEEEVQAPTNLNEAIEAKALEIITDPNIDLTQTTLRSSTAINRRALQEMKIAIVGLGGLGNHVVQQVAGMGFEKIYVFDPDTVEIHNVGPQRHPITFLGEYKVDVAEKINVLTNGFKFMYKGYDTLKGYADIYNSIGAPDVLITAVDNMAFRNSLADSFRQFYTNQCPKLLIDMRMTLGDWTTYVIPLQWAYSNNSNILNTYRNERFEQADAVQEACTERAIIYTGANAASYTCAVLHWFANNGQPSEDMLDMSSDAPIKYKMTFSSRDWEFITPTRKELMMLKNIRKLKEEVDTMEQELEKGRVPEVKVEPEPGQQTVEEAPEPVEEQLPPLNLDTLREGMLLRLSGENIIYTIVRVNDRGVTVEYDGEVTNISRAILAEGGCVL